MFSLHQEGVSAVFSLEASALIGQSFAITHTCHMLRLDPHISTQLCCGHNMKPHSSNRFCGANFVSEHHLILSCFFHPFWSLH